MSVIDDQQVSGSLLRRQYAEIVKRELEDKVDDPTGNLSCSMPLSVINPFLDLCMFKGQPFRKRVEELVRKDLQDNGYEIMIPYARQQAQYWTERADEMDARLKIKGSAKGVVLEKIINDEVMKLEITTVRGRLGGFTESNEPVGRRDLFKLLNAIPEKLFHSDVRLTYEILDKRVAKIKNKTVRESFQDTIYAVKVTNHPDLYPELVQEARQAEEAAARAEEEKIARDLKAEISKQQVVKDNSRSVVRARKRKSKV